MRKQEFPDADELALAKRNGKLLTDRLQLRHRGLAGSGRAEKDELADLGGVALQELPDGRLEGELIERAAGRSSVMGLASALTAFAIASASFCVLPERVKYRTAVCMVGILSA